MNSVDDKYEVSEVILKSDYDSFIEDFLEYLKNIRYSNLYAVDDVIKELEDLKSKVKEN